MSVALFAGAFFLGPSFGGFLLVLSPAWLAESDPCSDSAALTLSAALGGPSFAGVRVELMGGRISGRGVPAGFAGCSLGGSFGAVRTFHSGLAFGACLPRDAEMLMKSWSKKTSKDKLGIGIVSCQQQECSTRGYEESGDMMYGVVMYKFPGHGRFRKGTWSPTQT